jgi:hypothetical protein
MTEPADRDFLRGAGLSLANDSVTCALLKGLRERGLRAILLKGASLRRLLYEPSDVRVSADIDVLVEESRLEAVEAALPDLGFRYIGVDVADERRPSARAWLQEQTQIPLELHTSITGIDAAADVVWRVLSAETEIGTIGPCSVEMLNRAATALHVALNVAHHGRANAKTMADLELAVASVEPATWRAAVELARRVGALPAFAAGLRLHPSGEPLLRELGVDARPTPQIALRADTAPPLAQGIGWLAELPTTRARLGFVARSVFPPPGFMRVWAPSARRGRLWLAAAYFWRPFWILARLPRAIRAWRRARRVASAQYSDNEPTLRA